MKLQVINVHEYRKRVNLSDYLDQSVIKKVITVMLISFTLKMGVIITWTYKCNFKIL